MNKIKKTGKGCNLLISLFDRRKKVNPFSSVSIKLSENKNLQKSLEEIIKDKAILENIIKNYTLK